MISILRRNRSFVTARIWSTTATAAWPSQVSGTKSGGLPAGELERGITTTVRRCWFAIFVVSTRQGRVLRISAPSVGSSLTHQTSPRRGCAPRFGGFLGDGVELFFNGSNLRIVVCDSARFHQMLVPHRELFVERVRQVPGAFSRGNPAQKLLGQIFGQREGHFSSGHTPILPYKCRARCHRAPKLRIEAEAIVGSNSPLGRICFIELAAGWKGMRYPMAAARNSGSDL
jgi:hypothetical protein